MATSAARPRLLFWTRAALAALLGAAVVAPAAPACAAAAGGGGRPAAPAEPRGTGLLLFAAASLSDALAEIDHAFTARTGIPVSASFAASSVLAKQIEAGAPADVFFSADRDWIDYLEQRALLTPGSRRELLGNALALIAPADSAVRLNIAPGFDLVGALGSGRLATADPDSVPAGRYARAALTRLSVWARVSDRLHGERDGAGDLRTATSRSIVVRQFNRHSTRSWASLTRYFLSTNARRSVPRKLSSNAAGYRRVLPYMRP